ncbi:GLPGLI family protein [Chryseobacterium sp. JUb7]|uniref:GLPGLI family protein n=1 Tax=Chryseobacterium sp. JUb7 TaxID=2940599 RepID=UPI00216A4BE1|nr:GLPGLI family protein [Chryseobacterium sp. JUb7]MCS3529194.1 GLPGLI family protein [Chryseobacterium sp. JUb7]
MRKIIFLLGLCTGLFYQSQTNRFIYELQYRKDSTEDYKKSLMNLDINPESVKFYDKKFADNDSINKSHQAIVSKHSTRTDQLITRKPNSSKNIQYRDFFEYFIVKSDDEIEWNLSSDIQNYNGYKLQKATAVFGGRSWIAWFSNDINIKEGPYKFRGLPGLIFIIEDVDKNFIYKLVKNIKLAETYDTKSFLETHYGKQALIITNEKFNAYIEDIYKNPTRMLAEGIKKWEQTFF